MSLSELALRMILQQKVEVRHEFTRGMRISEAFSYLQTQSACFWLQLSYQEQSSRLQTLPNCNKTEPLREQQWQEKARTVCLPCRHVPTKPGMCLSLLKEQIPKYALSPIIGLHLPVRKAAIVIYCPSKEEPHFFISI